MLGVACCGVGCFAWFVFDVQGFGLLGFEWIVVVMWLVTLLVASGLNVLRVWFSG